jgi:competence protein ComEC
LWRSARRKPRLWAWWFGLVLLAAVFLGAARYRSAQPVFSAADLAFYNDRSGFVRVSGWLVEPPRQREGYMELRLESARLRFAGGLSVPVSGRLLARVDDGDWHYGDWVTVSGELKTPGIFDGFSYKDYLAREGVYSLMPFASAYKIGEGAGDLFWQSTYAVREAGLDAIRRLYPATEGALIAGILLGDESGLSENIKQAFNDTGTRHIVAISGFNISIIAGALLAVARLRLAPRHAVWLAGTGVALYTLLVGADPPVVRAAFMAGIGLLALHTGRQAFTLNTLAVTAAVMVLWNPQVLWDVGFQLSFMATLGIVVWVPRWQQMTRAWMESHLPRERASRLNGVLGDLVLITVAAQIATLPILLYHFERMTLLSLPANLLILPAQPALMMTAGLSVLLGMLWLPAGQLLAFAGWALAAYTIRIVEWFAGLPGSSFDIPGVPLWLVFAMYAGLLAVSVPAWRARLAGLGMRPAAGLAALSLLALAAWNSALSAPDGLLRVTMLNVDGETFLIQSPTGRNLLINTGPSFANLAAELQHHLPYGYQLDWLLLAGGMADQIGAAPDLLTRMPQTALASAGEGQLAQDAVSVAQEINLRHLEAGDSLALGDGAKLRIVATTPRGAVLLLTWQDFDMLLPIGIDTETLAALDPAEYSSDVVVLADYGLPALNPPDWLASLSPQAIWLAGGADLRDGELGFPVLAVHERGWIRAITNGEELWLESEH